MKFLGLNDFQFKDQRVLLRLDLNAPIEGGKVSNDERLIISLQTIEHILNNEGRLIVISHLGRPEEGNFEEKFSIKTLLIKFRFWQGLFSTRYVFHSSSKKSQ